MNLTLFTEVFVLSLRFHFIKLWVKRIEITTAQVILYIS